MGTDKRCVLINGKCEEHYNSCSGLEKSKCSQNIPSSNTQKCIWKDDTTGCVEEPRKCVDYIVYSEKHKKTWNANYIKLLLAQETEFVFYTKINA